MLVKVFAGIRDGFPNQCRDNSATERIRLRSLYKLYGGVDITPSCDWEPEIPPDYTGGTWWYFDNIESCVEVLRKTPVYLNIEVCSYDLPGK